MTAKQKAARAKFKAIVKEASKLRKKNPKLTQAQAVKQAWAISYDKKRSVVGAVKKKTATKVKAKKRAGTEMHTDTKSHNVNIRVLSGTKKTIKNKEKRIFGYLGTGRKGKYTTVHYERLSGYAEQPEIIVGKIGSVTALKELAPEVKVRITRGKKVASAKITSASSSVDILKKFISRSKVQTQEFAVAIFVNNNGNVLGVYQFGQGGYTATVMDYRLLMAAALKLGAVGIILAHNHPSGSLTPSDADKGITREIVKVANFHNMKVLDHIIITLDGYYSFAENGILR
jgi:DNA repair protein RadC